ncbi:4-phosphoerythronate dehydrogenase [Leptospira gomenensis]|uniref:4-phosphoerythronate dehydrogenase n=1 Tax=Leptospira gomenensis TaxID=2484974 RepID=A0A5F1YFS5_9LEPT|nr:NAD(P)-dependent oxidoreductase [Leptospira gomenensis]TGK39252.1 4-phosphoerythronate dehydrogenase [Leptospira gomenensis]TGK44002.1 4-phosphoerythronate dehydrogenase [Leptospira gomenensis]TGK48922.1 4-phosphoerythronate dehydrogenase [Leptospira gomenensis]TGK54632.1 4-phosphoerythronate dehydrogenase [Leptospira gomenensis]
MQQKRPILYYPEGTSHAEKIFAHFEKIEVRSYAPDSISNLISEKPEILIANTRLKVDENAVRTFPSVRIFATVSSGTDHVDFNSLKNNGRVFLNAPGCNAGSVAEYCYVSLIRRFSLSELKNMKVGMIGHGNTGKAFHKILKSKGISSVFYDPFYKAESSPLEEVLRSSVLSYHVPLTREGADSTYRMIGEKLISSLKPGTALINTSRGEIFSPEAFSLLLGRNDLYKVIDVFDPEPPSVESGSRLAEVPDSVFTPHIAGYSQIGRASGTYRVAEKLSILYKERPLPPLDSFLLNEGGFRTETFLTEEDAALRSAWKKGDAGYFERRRNSYPIRLDIGLV